MYVSYVCKGQEQIALCLLSNNYKEVKMSKEKKVKKEVKHRSPTKWYLHCAKVKEENPDMKQSEVMKLAKESYVK